MVLATQYVLQCQSRLKLPRNKQLLKPQKASKIANLDKRLSSGNHQLRRVFHPMGPETLRDLLMRTFAGYFAYVRRPRFWSSAQDTVADRPTDHPSATSINEATV